MSSIIDSSTLDKTVLDVFPLSKPAPDRTYWAQKTPEERLAAIEFLRILNYGEAAASARLQRLLTVTQLGKS